MSQRQASEAPDDDLASLRKSLTAAPSAEETSNGGYSLVEYRKRSRAVQRYALLRAGGICESCGEPAPFACEDGTPFLEVHHLLRLADDGPDAPSNVAAVCPNCHRAVHHALDRERIAAALSQVVADKEMRLTETGYRPPQTR